MSKIDLAKLTPRTGSIYPPPLDQEVAGRSSLRLGDAGGLTQFGANLVFLEPGAKSSIRHWHQNVDEFVMVSQGTLVLQMDDGETEMNPGDCAAFPAGTENGHCLINRSQQRAAFLVVGSRAKTEVATYTSMDLRVEVSDGEARFTYKDGTDWDGPR